MIEPYWSYDLLKNRSIRYVALSFNATERSLNSYRDMFPNYQSVLDYEKREEELYIYYVEERNKIILEHENKIRKNTK